MRQMRFASVLLLVLVGLACSISPLVASAQTANTFVRVIGSEAAVRLRPDAESEAIATVRVATVLEVTIREGEWYGVLLPPDENGLRRYGFVAAHLVEPLKPVANDMLPPQRGDVPAAAPPESTDAGDTDLIWGKKGLYLSLVILHNRFPGGLRGDPVLSNGVDLLIAPWRPGDKTAFGVSFGYRSRNWARELSFLRSSHPTTFLVPVAAGNSFVYQEAFGDATFNRLSVDGRRYWLRGSRIQPYLLIGASFPWFSVDGGAVVNGEVGTATFFGLGADVGAGACVHVYRGLSTTIGATYNYDFYLTARGGGGDWLPIEDLLSQRGLKTMGTITYTF